MLPSTRAYPSRIGPDTRQSASRRSPSTWRPVAVSAGKRDARRSSWRTRAPLRSGVSSKSQAMSRTGYGISAYARLSRPVTVTPLRRSAGISPSSAGPESNSPRSTAARTDGPATSGKSGAPCSCRASTGSPRAKAYRMRDSRGVRSAISTCGTLHPPATWPPSGLMTAVASREHLRTERLPDAAETHRQTLSLDVNEARRPRPLRHECVSHDRISLIILGSGPEPDTWTSSACGELPSLTDLLAPPFTVGPRNHHPPAVATPSPLGRCLGAG